MMGLEGMQSLYGMRPGEVEMYLDKNLQGRELAYNQQGNTYQNRMQNNPKRLGFYDWNSCRICCRSIHGFGSDGIWSFW